MGAFFANLSLLIAVVYYEIDTSFYTDNYDADVNSLKPAIEGARFNSKWAKPFRYSIAGTSGLAILCFTIRYCYRRIWIKSVLPSINESQATGLAAFYNNIIVNSIHLKTPLVDKKKRFYIPEMY